MNTRYVAVGLLLALAACSSNSGPAQVSGRAAAVTPMLGQAAVGVVTATQTHSFAALPDRGDLVSYQATLSRREGPSIWHRVDVSEEHALRTIGSGKMRMVAPNGQILDYRFQRHVEDGNGNWTWIGELPGSPGRKAIVTFGEKAVFGLFYRPGAEPLRLTIRNGVAWIVEASARAVRGVDAKAGEQDYLISPAAVKEAAMTKQSVESAGATATSGPVVDVALGYTAGLATSLGGQSQVATRLSHLVAVTNDAYVASGLNAQVRLVRTMQVSYPDNTSNDSALNELSGSTGTSSIPVPASLQPLRAARDQYGADLVSLVRKFNDPENDGCGIAWLIGGGGDPITTSYAPWGYSVVSDGSDGGFFCREATLAHEFGHNMGQAHNIEDSGGDSGAHPYSYGYRESSSTGFYTIMAYRASDTQEPIPYFATPNVIYDTRPIGVANTSDNVRSMAQTIPIVATFRATVVASIPTLPLAFASGDFDGDGKSDLLWRNSSNGADVLWKGASIGQTLATMSDQNWKVVGTGDFDGDGKSDIVWRHSVSGANALWKSGTVVQSLATVTSQTWKIAGVGDFDGDGRSDLLWRNSSTGSNSLWKAGVTGQSLTTVADQNWKVVAVGDFDGDGKSDILWRNASTGANEIWKSANSATKQVLASVGGNTWQIVGAGDFNADHKADILWRSASSGANTLWLGGTVGQSLTTLADQNWKVAGMGDYNGDGKDDIMWRNTVTGGDQIWNSANAATPRSLSTVSTTWMLVP